jgi:hypothetical protein
LKAVLGAFLGVSIELLRLSGAELLNRICCKGERFAGSSGFLSFAGLTASSLILISILSGVPFAFVARSRCFDTPGII